ncbi:MAG: hypothetical protein HPY79_05350 [Bacteroidales bacterium]|nr:hypothetical protein [Bacteroidales bacterium]
MKKLFFLILVLLTTFFVFKNIHSLKPNYIKNLTFTTDDSVNTLIVIKNQNQHTVEFNFSLNNKFYASLNDFIRKNKNSNDSEQIVLNLFHAFINSIVHEKLFNDWGAIPLTTLNSKGFAICGWQSEIFSQILYNAGFKSKVLHLEGHAVSEVFYNGSWHLFDTDRKTFFKKGNKILNYKELIHFPLMFKKNGTKKYMANLTTLSKKYTNHFITGEDNKPKEINNANNDTFLLNLPAKASFVFPFYPDYKRDFYPYNTKAKLFIPKGFNGKIKNPLILIDVEGKGKIKINNREYLVPDELELLKASIIKSNKFIDKIKVEVFSDTLALVYMLNPLFTKIYKKNILSINASDSLVIKIDKNREKNKNTIYPTHLELLNQYTPFAHKLASEISLFNINSVEELYHKQLKPYCISNAIDTNKLKKRLMLIKHFVNKPIYEYSEVSNFYGFLALLLNAKDEEFRNIFIFNIKYLRYKHILNKYYK